MSEVVSIATLYYSMLEKIRTLIKLFLPLELVMQVSNKYHTCIIVATRAWWKPYNVHMVDDLYNNTNY